MAPYRASRSTRSGRPQGQNDVDIIDGLPVRQWRKQEVFVGLNAADSDPEAAQASAQEEQEILPNGRPPLKLPHGYQYYTPWCQQILKAARAGRLKRKEPDDGHEDEEKNAEQDENAEAPKMGFLAKKWNALPRHMESQERSYLAPRRPGLLQSAAVANQSVGPNGETLINGAPVEEPTRRRMPPPRRKPKKGPGRRKKMTEGEGGGVSASAEALEGQQPDGSNIDGEAQQGGEGGVDDHDEGEEEEGEGSEEGEIADDDQHEAEPAQDEDERKRLLDKFQPTPTLEPEPEPEPETVQNPPDQDIPEPPSVEPLSQPLPTTDVDMDADEEEYEPPPPPLPKPEDEEEEEEYEPYEPPPPKEPIEAAK